VSTLFFIFLKKKKYFYCKNFRDSDKITTKKISEKSSNEELKDSVNDNNSKNVIIENL